MLRTFTLLGLEFSVYWTVFFSGVAAMLGMNLLRRKRSHLHWGASLLLTMCVIVISFVGAKIMYYLENPHVLRESGLRVDGVSFFGSVFLVPIAMLLVSKLCRKDYREMMDFLSPSLMLMLAVLRVGCFLTGCCEGVMINVEGVELRFPAQLTECVFDLLLMAGLMLYNRFWTNKGRLYPFIMVYYGLFRFCLEFFRNSPKEWLGLSHAQWFAIASVIIGSVWLVRMGRLDRQAEKREKRKSTHRKR